MLMYIFRTPRCVGVGVSSSLMLGKSIRRNLRKGSIGSSRQLPVTCLNVISSGVSVAPQRNQGCLEDPRLSSACEGLKRFEL